MSFLRPEAKALLLRWAEPLSGAVLVGLGLYTLMRGGWLLMLIGLALTGLGLAWAVLGLRRARFQGDPQAPGLVEIDEGRLRYLHPSLGGEISLHDLETLRLLQLRGRRVWQLQDLFGRKLLIPLDAAGAGALFDALSALPGLHSARLARALDAPESGGSPQPDGAEGADAAQTVPAIALRDQLVWSRAGQALRRQ